MKLITLILTGALVLSLGGCAASGGSAQESPSTTEPETQTSAPTEAEPETGAAEPAGEAEPALAYQNHTGDVWIDVTVGNEVYDHDAVIDTKVVITNNGPDTIAYVQGSGSAIAPDALRYELGELVKLFVPAMMTMDYRVDILKPGDTLELELNFAPYIAKDKNAIPGTDKTIDDFKNDDFTPAEAGTVEGEAVFTFRRLPEGADESSLLAGMEELPEESVDIAFSVAIA